MARLEWLEQEQVETAKKAAMSMAIERRLIK
jgi:hypothetical protein